MCQFSHLSLFKFVMLTRSKKQKTDSIFGSNNMSKFPSIFSEAQGSLSDPSFPRFTIETFSDDSSRVTLTNPSTDNPHSEEVVPKLTNSSTDNSHSVEHSEEVVPKVSSGSREANLHSESIRHGSPQQDTHLNVDSPSLGPTNFETELASIASKASEL